MWHSKVHNHWPSSLKDIHFFAMLYYLRDFRNSKRWICGMIPITKKATLHGKEQTARRTLNPRGETVSKTEMNETRAENDRCNACEEEWQITLSCHITRPQNYK